MFFCQFSVCGNVQHTSLAPDKEVNSLIYGSPVYGIFICTVCQFLWWLLGRFCSLANCSRFEEEIRDLTINANFNRD